MGWEIKRGQRWPPKWSPGSVLFSSPSTLLPPCSQRGCRDKGGSGKVRSLCLLHFLFQHPILENWPHGAGLALEAGLKFPPSPTGMTLSKVLDKSVPQFPHLSSRDNQRPYLTACFWGLKTIVCIKSEVKVAQSCPTLCNPTDCTVHGILQARILQWVAYSFSRGSSQPRDRTSVSYIAGGFFTNWAIREALHHSHLLALKPSAISFPLSLCYCT